jgi:hypothetical protein
MASPTILGGDTDAAIKFLQQFRPSGPWTLSYSGPGLPTRTFAVDEVDEARAWIDKHQGVHNLYFTIAETTHPVSKKPTKADIKQSRWLWAEGDPQKSVAERPGILARFRSADPKPTCIIDSGGGYWGFWELDEVISPAETERLNKGLRDQFGGDHVFNCDRIARLPGTVNLPDEKKRAKGQRPRVARATSLNGDHRRYTTAQIENLTADRAPADDDDGLAGSSPHKAKDESRSGIGWHIALRLARSGERDIQPFWDELRDDPDVGSWSDDKRQVERTWERAVQAVEAEEAARATAFDTEPNEDGTQARLGEPGKAKAETSLAYFDGDDAKPELANDYLVKGVLGRGSLAVVYGDSAAGKTFLVLRMVYCTAAGAAFFGRRTRPGAIVYIAAEAGGTIKNRVVAVRDTFPLQSLPVRVITSKINLYAGTVDLKRIIGFVKATEADFGVPVVAIVIDTLARAIPGANENASDDMGLAIGRMDSLREATGAAVVLVHHSGKDASKGARGWSGLRAAVDHEIEVTRHGDIRYADLGSKQRDAKDSNLVSFELEVVQLGEDDDGEQVTTCVVKELNDHAPPPAAKGKKRSRSHQAVIDTLEELRRSHGDDVTYDKLIDACTKPGVVSDAEKPDSKRRAARRAFQELEDENFVYRHGDIVSPHPDMDDD